MLTFSIRAINKHDPNYHFATAQAAEEEGFDQYWLSNDILRYSALAILSALAVKTERIQLGSGILNPYTLHPAEIAMFAATVDEISGGRFNLGVAAGDAGFLASVGVGHERPLATVSEAIDIICGLLAGEAVAPSGQRYSWPKPSGLVFKPRRHVPIYVGASGPKMVELAARKADGLLPLLLPPEHFFNVKAAVSRHQDAARQEAFDLVGSFWTSVGADLERSRDFFRINFVRAAKVFMPTLNGRPGFDREEFERVIEAVDAGDLDAAAALATDRMLGFGLIGDARALIDRLEPMIEGGLRHISFGPPFSYHLPEAIAMIGREVIPHLRHRYR